MTRERLDGWCEKGILGLVLAALVFGPLAIGGAGALPMLVLQALIAGAALLWGLRLWLVARPKLLWPPICWAVLAFTAYAIVRYFQADVEYAARQELVKVIVYALLFFVVLNNLHRQESTQIIVLTLALLATGICFYAIYQYAAKTGRVWWYPTQYPGRASGTFICPNSLGGYLEMLLPLTLAYVLVGRVSHVTKIFLGYAAVAMIAGIGASLSRGSWLASGLAVFLLVAALLLDRNYRIQTFALAALLVLAGLYIVPKIEKAHLRWDRMFAESGKVEDMRFSIWHSAIQMWRDNFWWGAGPAQFDCQFPRYRTIDVQARPDHAHNDYLNTLADWGLAGTLLAAAAWVLLYAGVFKSWKTARGERDDFSRKKSNKFALLVGASLGLAALLAHSLVDFDMHIPANAMLAVTLMALLTSQLRFATERHWFTAGAVTKTVLTLALLAGTGYLGLEGWRAGIEFNHLRVAARAGKKFTRTRIAALEKAFAVEPMNFDTVNEIADSYRMHAFEGNDDSAEMLKRELAALEREENPGAKAEVIAPTGNGYQADSQKALEWYERGLKLNPYFADNWSGYGMCLDWLGQKEKAGAYFQRANELDPNGCFTSARVGWHYVQTGDYAAARTWFNRSRQLDAGADNLMPYQYLQVVNQRLEEAANPPKSQPNIPLGTP
ncbi:MAG TPA: O-antigen ligase family protein [Verrucomicrobiae bacterium]|nr:O-antigen ligase family protein [Verrucomicrobiae bacterium]